MDRSSAMKACLAVAVLFMFTLEVSSQVIVNDKARVFVGDSSVVTSNDLINNASGDILNYGYIILSRNLTNAGINGGNGFFRLAGNWTNTGVFNPGLSTVTFQGITDQMITRPGGENFYNLAIANTGPGFSRIVILNDINISRSLRLSSGNIDAGNFNVYLSHPSASSLIYASTTGSRILGNFERGVGETGKYLFPLGTVNYYNPLNFSPNSAPAPGSVLSRFFMQPPSGGGFPIADPPVEISRIFKDGYWVLTARNGFASGNFSVDLTAAGFIDSVHYDTRLIRTDGAGNWIADGTHMNADTVNRVVYRNSLNDGLSPSGTRFALGRPRPLIIDQPNDTTVCEETYPFFEVRATGSAALRYTWFKVGPPDIEILNNNPHFTGARTSRLTILGATLTDTGYYYCIIRDRFGNSTRTDTVHLSVKKIPRAMLTNAIQPQECSNVAFDPIILGLTYWDDPGTTFYWWRTEPDSIESTVPANGTASNIGDVINGTFTNLTDNPIMIDFFITPIGPDPTYCRGANYPAHITVNPTPRVTPVNMDPDICYGDLTDIDLTTRTQMTSGTVLFDYNVTKTGGVQVVGSIDPKTNLPDDYSINLRYKNNSTALQTVTYHITPIVSNGICPAGLTVDSEVRLHAYPVNGITTIEAITCAGLGTGELRAEISTGAEPYVFAWEGPDNFRSSLQLIDHLHSGYYQVKVTDDAGCDSTVFTYLIPPDLEENMYPHQMGIYNISCAGATDGRLTISVISAMTLPPYNVRLVKDGSTVVWSGVFTGLRNPMDPSTYAVVNGLGAGEYVMFTTDINNCEYQSDPVTLLEPAPVTTVLDKKFYEGGFNINCKGYDSGRAWVKSVSGGRGGYTYHWTTSDGSIPAGMETNDTITGITAGTYYLEIRDIMNCVGYDTIQIIEPAGMSLAGYQLSMAPDGVNNVTCNGASDGSINLQIIGGSGVYLHKWYGPDGFTSSLPNLSGLRAGVYTDTIKDQNGCILIPAPEFTLIEPPVLTVSATTSSSVNGGYEINCSGGTGSVDVSVNGGSGAYTYTWTTINGSGIVQGVQDQSALRAGTYHLVVKDVNGCQASIDVTLDEPPALVLQADPTHITCASPGFSNGAVNLTATGGEGAYSYLWSNGALTEDITGLTEGVYTVTVTYNNTCTGVASARVNLPAPISYTTQLSNYRSYEISCNGLADGSINLTITSGKAPYIVTWTKPDGTTLTAEDISGLTAGDYQLLITDANQCTATGTITLRQPGQLGMTFDLSLVQGGFNIACAGDNSGTITVNPVNSVNNVTYLWSDGFTGRSRSSQMAGEYSVIITDDNNCQAEGEITLTQPDSIKIEFEVKRPYCPDMDDGEIVLDVTGGVIGTDYMYKWSDNSTGRNVSAAKAGLYIVQVTDLNGCTARDSVIVEPLRESCLEIPNVFSPNQDGVNEKWEIGMTGLYPEMVVKVFNRWGRLVWQSDRGYPVQWDGRSNGKAVPVDSYHYTIDLKNGTRPVIGNVTIVK